MQSVRVGLSCHASASLENPLIASGKAPGSWTGVGHLGITVNVGQSRGVGWGRGRGRRMK